VLRISVDVRRGVSAYVPGQLESLRSGRGSWKVGCGVGCGDRLLVE
jgi:hypothetical protein